MGRTTLAEIDFAAADIDLYVDHDLAHRTDALRQFEEDLVAVDFRRRVRDAGLELTDQEHLLHADRARPSGVTSTGAQDQRVFPNEVGNGDGVPRVLDTDEVG